MGNGGNNAKNAAIQTKKCQISPKNPKATRRASLRSELFSVSLGLYVPALVVYVNDDNQIVIVEGHKRRRGALLAIEAGYDLGYVDCVPFRGNAAERVELMLRSGEGQPFKPLEVAFGVLRLSRWGYSNEQIAERIGKKSAANVEQMLLLATANPDVHDLVRSGAVSATVAIETVREHGEKAGPLLNERLTVIQAAGKSKLTSKVIHGWAPSKKVVSTLVSSVEELVNALHVKASDFDGLSDDELDTKTVEVKASELVGLLRLQAQMSEAKAGFDESLKGA